MSSTDRTLLLHLFTEAKKNDYPTLDDPSFFEIFVAFHYLKHFDLDYSDIEQGIVDGAKDGGIDSVYCLCDGRLISEVDPLTIRKNALIQLFVFTTKFQNSFPTSVINDVRVTLSDLLEFDKEKTAKVFSNYNDEVWDAFLEFRQFFFTSTPRFPTLKITLVYATAASDAAKSEVTSRLDQIASDLQGKFSDSLIETIAADARLLLAAVREPADETRSLRISGNSVNLPKGPSYIVLSRLTDYYSFISSGGKELEQRLFDDNVRDYEGDVQVNKEIGDTLSKADQIDFWWLNNGASIICDSATLSGDQLQMSNPKIVNGLQTSRRIYEHFAALKTSKKDEELNDDRLVLVRVITAKDDDVRSEIIRATNRQTPISPAQLVATASIHKDIELHFKAHGKYYERRKNYWKNQGKPKSEIITITDLAQAVMTTVAGRPHTARARPGSLLKESNNDVFDMNIDVKLYAKAIDLVRSTDLLIAQTIDAGIRDRNNIKYHVVAKIVYESCGKEFSAQRFLSNKIVEPDVRKRIIQKVYSLYEKKGSTDKVAKSEDFWISVKNLKVSS